MYVQITRGWLLGLVALVTFGLTGLSLPSAAATSWADEGSATITPGVQMYTDGGQCTANFVFTDSAGTVYVGYAAHCAGTGEATETDGCTTESLPPGTPVSFRENGNLLTNGQEVGTGTLAYSSWHTMQEAGESDADVCAYNDFALVEVDAESVADVNPTVPFWGGPNGLASTGASSGERIFSVGNSSLRAGVKLLSPKIGFSLGQSGDGWSHDAYTLTPGIPGDSGSGLMDADGNAFGVLSTLALAPLPASNGIGNLAFELEYANTHSQLSGLSLASGTSAFDSIL